MTDSGDQSPESNGGDGDEAVGADEDLDALHLAPTALRSARHGGREMDGSADTTEEQANDDAPAAAPDRLDELAPVSSSLRSAQNRASNSDTDDADDADGTADADDSVEASDAEESGDA